MAISCARNSPVTTGVFTKHCFQFLFIYNFIYYTSTLIFFYFFFLYKPLVTLCEWYLMTDSDKTLSYSEVSRLYVGLGYAYRIIVIVLSAFIHWRNKRHHIDDSYYSAE